jgi:hypothetical protein
MVVMKAAANPELAERFAAAVRSPESGVILQRHGLPPP